jgi:hypothetical protein
MERNIEIRTGPRLRFHQNDLFRILVKFRTSLLMLERKQPFDGTSKEGSQRHEKFFIAHSV